VKGSTSHAPWDVDAVPGAHARYSGKNLGTAPQLLARRTLSSPLVPLGEADECIGEFRRIDDLEVCVQQAEVEGELVWRV
jgi:hypothetical protein